MSTVYISVKLLMPTLLPVSPIAIDLPVATSNQLLNFGPESNRVRQKVNLKYVYQRLVGVVYQVRRKSQKFAKSASKGKSQPV